MEARIAPPWDVRHRITVAFGSAVVAVAAVLAGMMQQLWERDPWSTDLWADSWISMVGLGSIAAIFVAFMMLAAASFLLPSRRGAAILVLLLTAAAAWPLFALAWRLFLAFVNPMRAVM